MKINVNNTRKIEDALRAVNGTARSFTLASAADVRSVAADAEERLSFLTKQERIGAYVNYHPAGPSAKSYKYAAISTTIFMRRYATGWFLTGATRSEIYPRAQARACTSFTACKIPWAKIKTRA